jgi:Dyp-type peroxidase family
MEKVEWKQVQRVVLTGYGHLPYSAYVLWRFQPGDNAPRKKWLAALTDKLRPAVSCEHEIVAGTMASSGASSETDDDTAPSGDTQPAIHLALTASGLDHLGVTASDLNSFSSEFLEGMAPQPTAQVPIPRRTNVLGDLGASSPEFWDWGGWKEHRDIDGLLLLYAADKTSLKNLIQAEIDAMSGIACADPIILEGRLYDDRKEHFGYVDGLSQPKIEGRPKRNGHKHKSSDQNHTVKPGEFLLGYCNERRSRISNDRDGVAKSSHDKHARDIRRNGSYLVFRQIEQDVPAFERFVSDLAKRLGETDDWVAAHLLGRCKDGKPLVASAPDARAAASKPGTQAADPKPGAAATDAKPDNNFLYYHEDRSGLVCPIGAHIRRANPRDSLGPDPDTALRLSKMHRIIRRGRPYGARRDANPGTPDDGTAETRGMLFIALNADIAGQFEMIQHSWLNNPNFNGLYSGTDPISHYLEGDGITIQSRPTNLHVKRPEPFTKVRGGAYFFLPGIQALREIAASAR